MGKKGVSGLEIAIIGVIAMFVAISSLVIFVTFLKIHLVKVLEIQYGYNNAGLTLVELLSDDDIYEGISLAASGVDNDGWIESELKTRLDMLVPGGCYQLILGEEEILHPDDCEINYVASSYIVLPFNDDPVEKITLGIPEEVSFIEVEETENSQKSGGLI